MSVFYNLTQLQAAEKVSDIFVYSNDMSQGVLAGLVLISVFFVMLIAMKRFEFAKALLSSSFACFILGLFLKSTGTIAFILVVLFGVIFAFTTLYVFITQRGNSNW